MTQLHTLLDGLSFPEGPRWHQGQLWFSDFYTYTVIAVGLDGSREDMAHVPGQPSGLGWLPDGRLLVVSMTDRKLLRLDPDGLHEAADLSAYATFHCNDMVVDGAGRAYVGNFGFDHYSSAEPIPARLIRVDPDGTVTPVADELWFPNGTVITPDGATLIVGESRANRLTAWDRAPDGSLSNRRVWADLGRNVPDGICLDTEGAIWSADPRNREIIRVREGGEVTERISTGERGAYACMLGGEDRRTLFICTNTASGQAAAQRRDGRIDYVRVAVPGAGWP